MNYADFESYFYIYNTYIKLVIEMKSSEKPA